MIRLFAVLLVFVASQIFAHGWPDSGGSGSGTVTTVVTEDSAFLEDATHVWVEAADNIQTACTSLNTALNAANTDGWLYVWGGTHTVTAPLVCNGASSTEIMHVICMGGEPGINNAVNSGCRIVPTADAASEATMSIGHTDLQGFYIEADADSGDYALKVTNAADIHRNALNNPDSAGNPATKYVIRVDNTAATTPVVNIYDNYLNLFCSSSSPECDENSAAVRIDSGETGNDTDNTYITNNRIVMSGTNRAVGSDAQAVYFQSGDRVEISDNNVDLFQNRGKLYRTQRDGTTEVTVINNIFRAADSFSGAGGTANSWGYFQTLGAGDVKNIMSAWIGLAQDDTDNAFSDYTGAAVFPSLAIRNRSLVFGDSSTALDTRLERPSSVTSTVAMDSTFGGFGGFRTAVRTSGSTCSSAREGTMFYDSDVKKLCICVDTGGAVFVYRAADGTVGTATSC